MHRLKRLISPRKLAYAGAELDGVFCHEEFSRLKEAVDCSADVRVSLRFYLSDEGKPMVSGSAVAELAFFCQRCLTRMAPQEEHLDFCYAIVRSEEEARQLPRSLDPWLVAEDEADLCEQIEDELLLSLPLVAYHDYPCNDSIRIGEGSEGATAVEKRPNPFDVLAQLKKDK